MRPKKHLGQNFLIDENIVQRIIKASELHMQESILEIGPGQGALTKEIVKLAHHVYAIETDQQLCQALKNRFPTSRVHIIHADFLKYNLQTLPSGMKVMGNLPYYISTPIIEKLITHQRLFHHLFLTLQLEFGKRLVAKADCKDYGSLSCFVQYYYDAKILFKITRTCFRPSPKVTSCFMQLVPREPVHKAINEVHLFKIIQQAFQQRRKRVSNALSPLIKREKLDNIFRQLGVDKNVRAENLMLKNYIDISNAILRG